MHTARSLKLAAQGSRAPSASRLPQWALWPGSPGSAVPTDPPWSGWGRGQGQTGKDQEGSWGPSPPWTDASKWNGDSAVRSDGEGGAQRSPGATSLRLLEGGSAPRRQERQPPLGPVPRPPKRVSFFICEEKLNGRKGQTTTELGTGTPRRGKGTRPWGRVPPAQRRTRTRGLGRTFFFSLAQISHMDGSSPFSLTNVKYIL